MIKSATGYSHSLRKSLKSKYSFEIPDKYKDRFIGKWALFWKNLYLDYKDVVVETAAKAREKPGKAFIMFTGLGGILYCCSLNPDERNYQDSVLRCRQELALVGCSIRSPSASQHLDHVSACLDAGEVRYLNLGALSLVWEDTCDSGLGIYSAQCPYLRPSPLDWPGRLLDVGFLGRWWLLHRAMQDYDINPGEFGGYLMAS